MKALRIVLLVLLLGAAAAFAASQSGEMRTTERLPGVDLTEGISQITGVAISPLLGVSALGAWRYYRASASQRERLPWFCQPVFWGAGFALLALCLLKDTFGLAVPALVKKPLDMVELFENKASALIASAAFLPFLAAQLAEPSGEPAAAQSAYLHVALSLPAESVGPALGAYWIALPLCLVAFAIVWLSAHAVNVLIALSPFGLLDAFLKLARLSVLSAIVVSCLVSPWLGAAFSLAVICIAAVLAPWAFRLTVFGTLLAIDILAASRVAPHAQPQRPHAFLARRIGAVRVRTLGRLTRDAEDRRCFEYRPWFFLAVRRIALPPGRLAISRGIFFPSLLHSADDAAWRNLVNFPPRYRGREAEIAARFGISEIRDGVLVRGFKAVRLWIGHTLNPQR